MSGPRSERSPAWRWWVCGLLLLATMLNYMDRQTLSQSATDIARELGLSNEVSGLVWVVLWLAVIRGGDLARADADAPGAPEVSTSSRGAFVRRFLVLALVVVAINLCWHFYRAWMPKMLREQLGYRRGAVNYF